MPRNRKYYLDKMQEVGRQNYKVWGFKTPQEATAYAMQDRSYDYEGYYNKYPESTANSKTHWTDEFKGVIHPTFSDESIYHGKIHPIFNPYGLRGGYWINNIYQPHIGLPRKHLASGGSIYIKPSHRGRLTELKERTGKSEAELYSDGNPAHKKMVVFARNARKWKH